MLTHQNIVVADFMAATREAFTATINNCGVHINAIDVTADVQTAAVSWTVVSPGSVSVHLHMPRMKADARLTRAEADALTGYWLHELGHCLYSTPSIMRDMHDEGGKRLSHILNALEDPRMEKCVIDNGVATNARKLFESLAARMQAKSIAAGWKVNNPASVAWTIAILGRALACGYDIDNAQALYDASKGDVRKILDLALPAIRAAQTDLDLVDTARAIVAIMQAHDSEETNDDTNDEESSEESRDDTNDEESSDDTNDEESSDDTSDDDTNDEESSDDTNDDDTNDEESSDESSEESSEASSDDTSEESSDEASEPDTGHSDANDVDSSQSGNAFGDGGDAEPDASEVSDSVNERSGPSDITDAIQNALSGLGTMIPLSTHTGVSTNDYRNNTAGYKRHKNRIDNPTKLRRDVATLCHSPDRFWKDAGQDHGRLDTAALARGMAGARNVFMNRRMEDGEDALIWLLLDLSSSMRGNEIRDAACLAIHLGEAIESNAGRYAITGFVSSDLAIVNGHMGVETADLVTIKPEASSIRACRGELAQLPRMATSGTPLTSAIVVASREMAKAPATRHVLIVLTDGDDGLGADGIKASTDYAAARGVETIGLELSRWSRAGADAWPRHQLINDLSKLATTGLDEVIKGLRR